MDIMRMTHSWPVAVVRKLPLVVALVGLLLLSAAPARAAVTAFKSHAIDPSPGGPALANYITNDITIDFTGQWTGAQAKMGPFGAGSIYQDPAGSTTPPIDALIPAFPSLAYDTFVTGGAPSGGSIVAVQATGAVLLGGGPFKFDDSEIDIAWNPFGGIKITDKSNFLIMRLTLSKNANGTALFLASAGGTPSSAQGRITGGVLSFVPEPASSMLGLVGCLGLTALVPPRRKLQIAGRSIAKAT